MLCPQDQYYPGQGALSDPFLSSSRKNMKRTLPLLAVLAATLTTPVMAQNINSILNPGNFAARLNSGSPAMAGLPSDMSGLFQGANPAARLNPALNSGPVPGSNVPGSNVVISGQIAALAPPAEVHSLAPRTSMVPMPRGGIARVIAAPTAAAPVVAPVTGAGGSDLIAMMADAAEAAPEGSNTLVINGSNTAVIASSPTALPATTEATRPSLWQRWFGL